MSQSELASGLVTKSMISQIESDRVQPSRDLLVALAGRLGVTAEELLPAQSMELERAARYKQAQSLLALGHQEEALALLLACLDDPHPAWPLRELTEQAAGCLQRLGRLEEARAWYERALRLAVREGEARAAMHLRCRLGEVAAALGQAEVARQEWRMALREWESGRAGSKAPGAEAKATGSDAKATGSDAKATGSDAMAPGADAEWIASVHLGLALAEQELGRLDAALAAFQQAVEALRGTRGLWKMRASAHAGLGQMLERLERWTEAAEHLDLARTLYEQARERRAAIEVRAQHARLLGRFGRRDEAEAEFAECLRLALTHGDSELAGQVLVLQSQHLQSLGEQEPALRTLREAIRQLPSDDRCIGQLYQALADAMWQSGDKESARTTAEEAVLLFDRAGREQELQSACRLLAQICKGAGDFQAARDWNAKVNGLLCSRLITKKNLRTHP